jgi:hypothetical protein
MSADPIELSHGQPHLTRKRPSDLEAIDTRRERNRSQNKRGLVVEGNELAKDRGAKHALTGPLKAIRDGVQDAAGGALATEDARVVVSAALKLYVANRRALGTGKVPVLARLVRASVNDALATFYTAEAARVGFGSEAGLAYVDAAHRCEARAERGMTAAIAFVRAIGTGRAKGDEIPPWFLADGEETK